MITIRRTDSSDADFIALVTHLDEYLRGIFGTEQAVFDRYNKVGNSQVVVANMDGAPVGCGCLRKYNAEKVELKRMFVPAIHRGKGIAGKVLDELENWAAEMNYKSIILETGAPMQMANKFYVKIGYVVTEKFAPYENSERSVCMIKKIQGKK